MSIKYTGLTLVAICCLFFASCKNQTSVEEGLSYDEYIRRAKQYQYENKMGKAITYYEKALELRPSDANIHFMLGELYDSEYRKSYDDARRELTSYQLTHPAPAGIYFKGDTKALEKYGLKKEYKDLALREFKDAIKYDPKNWMARYLVATNLFNERQYREAIQEFIQVIELNPQYSNAYSIVGEAYMKLGSYDLAVKYLNSALMLDPNSEYNYYNLGLVYRKMNNGEKVNEILTKLKNMHSTYYDELRLSIFRGNN